MQTWSFYMFFINCSEKAQFNHFLFCFYKLKDKTLKCLYIKILPKTTRFIVINHFIVSQFHWNYKTNKQKKNTEAKKQIKIKVFFLHCQPVRIFTLTHANNLPLSFPTNCTVTYLFPSQKQTKATNATTIKHMLVRTFSQIANKPKSPTTFFDPNPWKLRQWIE